MTAPVRRTDERWQPHIIAFVCRWCSYAGADMAGTMRLDYPASVRLVRFPCTGRMSPIFILKAFEQGADGVLVSGCHPGDCHYVQGNLLARRRFRVFRALMELVGLDPRRLHFAWVSASEGLKWARVVRQVTAEVQAAGPVGSPAPSVTPATSPAVGVPTRGAAAQRPAAEAGTDVQEILRERAAALLADGTVSAVLGFRPGPLPDQIVPVFARTPAQAGSLVWSPHVPINLFAYLREALARDAKVAVVAKRCDVRALVGLVQEGQAARQDVVVIGMACHGVMHGGTLAATCHTCTGEPPDLSDITIGEASDREPEDADPRDAELAFLEALTPAERWGFWQQEFGRCLRCYACRAVCPLCYCDRCIAEKHRPQWITPAIDERGNTAWNLVRALHLAGRCSGCDACAHVCPADIRLDLLNRALALEVERQFGYRPGEDVEARLPLATFDREDAEEFFL